MESADIYNIIDIVLLGALVINALAVVLVGNLLTASILLSLFSLLMASMYLILGAPDVAITEAAVGAGISTILLLAALLLTGVKEKKTRKSLLPLLVIAVTFMTLVYATADMPLFGDPSAPTNTHVAPYYLNQSYHDMGIPNVVTSILASYRGFDTLGETAVVFTAAMSILLLLGGKKRRKQPK